MANPENQVRPFIEMDTFAYPLNNPLLKMKTNVSLFETWSTPPSSLLPF
jgi:hypothetical protein